MASAPHSGLHARPPDPIVESCVILLEPSSLPAPDIFWHNGTVSSSPLATPGSPRDDAHHGAQPPPATIPALLPAVLTAGAMAWAGLVTLGDFSPAWPGVALAVPGFLLGGRVGRPLLRGAIQFVAVAACIALAIQIAAVVGAAWAVKQL